MPTARSPSSAPAPTGAVAIGHVVAADLIAGERWDLRRLPRGWDGAGFDDARWATVVAVADHGYAGLVDSPAPPVRRVEELTPGLGQPARRAAARSSTSGRTSTAGLD